MATTSASITDSNAQYVPERNIFRYNLYHWIYLSDLEPLSLVVSKLATIWQLSASLSGLSSGFCFVVLTSRPSMDQGSAYLDVETKLTIYASFLTIAFLMSIFAACTSLMFIGFTTMVKPSEKSSENEKDVITEDEKLLIRKIGLLFDIPLVLNIGSIGFILLAGLFFISGNYSDIVWYLAVGCGSVLTLFVLSTFAYLWYFVHEKICVRHIAWRLAQQNS